MAGTQIIPTFRYRDAHAAIDFLCDAFGFERHQVHEGPGDTVGHAELRLGDGFIMLGSLPPADAEDRLRLTAGGGSTYVPIDGDVDDHFARATAAGGDVVYPVRDTDYGSREYSVRDPEGNVWSFGSYRPS